MIEVETSALEAVVARTHRVAATRSSMPVLGMVRLRVAGGAVSAEATDLYTTARASRLGAAQPADGEEMDVLVDAKLIAQLAKRLPGKRTRIEMSDGRLELKSGRTRYRVETLPGAELPPTPAPVGGKSVVPAAALLDVLSKVDGVAKDDSSRPQLSGVLLEMDGAAIHAVATDGHRLTAATASSPCRKGEALIPVGGVRAVRQFLEAHAERQLTLVCKEGALALSYSDDAEDSAVVVRLAQERFPPWSQVVPQPAPPVVFDRAELLAAVQRVASVIRPSDRDVIRLAVASGCTTLSAGDGARAAEEVPCGWESDAVVVDVNPGYLAEALRVISDEQVGLEITSDVAPVVLRRDGFLGVVMPVRA